MTSRKPKRLNLDRVQVIRTTHLLHMRYAPSELAAELQCDVSVIYRNLIPLGCPHVREGKHIWLVGSEVREWVRAMAGGTRTGIGRMPEGMAHCFRCKQRVPFTATEVIPWGHGELVRGTCNVCGCRVNRAQRRGTAAANGQE